MAQTLGQMSVKDLLDSARSEASALADLTRRVIAGEYADDPAHRSLLIGAYEGSILSRIAVASMKIEDGEA